MKARSFRLVCVLLSLVVSAVAWAAPEWKVEPGVGIGPFVIGADWKSTDGLLTRSEFIPQETWGWVRYTEGVDLHLEHGKILEVMVHSSVVRTKSGPVPVLCQGNLKIGDSVQAMEAAYGTNYKYSVLKTGKSEPPQAYYAYVSEGLAFQTRGGQIYIIIVWPRRAN